MPKVSGAEGDWLAERRRNDPRAHPVGATASSATDPQPTPVRTPSARIATPTKPTASPIPVRRRGRGPPRIHDQSTSWLGIVAMNKAVTPVGTVCSATPTRALPSGTISTPAVAAAHHWGHVAAGAPPRRAPAIRIGPAIPIRIPAIDIGGRDAMAMSMAR